MSAIDGLTEDEYAHLSPGRREKLMAERKRGSEAVKGAQERLAYSEKLQGRTRELQRLDPEDILRERESAQEQRAEAAQETQAENIRVNLQKEANDAFEEQHGRGAVNPSAAEMAQELIEARTTQARDVGLTPNTGFIGHPEASEEQADAASANAAKEVQDRAEAPNYDANASYQGVTEEVAPATKYDDWGNPIEGEGETQAYGAETGVSEGNGQPEYTPEPTATDLIAGVGEPEPPKRRRGRPPSSTRAVGDGPVSE